MRDREVDSSTGSHGLIDASADKLMIATGA
jgi:hypothetical protein